MMIQKSSAGFFFINLSLAILGAIFFVLSHPNYIIVEGIPFFAYFAVIPFLVLIKRTKFVFSFFWGAFSGLCSYFIFNCWLFDFHPMAMTVVLLQTFFVYAFLFLVLKFFDLKFENFFFLLAPIAWIAFEYLKTKGFMGYPYGILAYTQWSFPVLIRISSVFGVWIISFLIVFFSGIITEFFLNKGKRRCVKFFCIWLVVFIACILYGVFTEIDYKNNENYTKSKIALVQPNMDPWLGNIEVCKQNFEDLKKLSQKAIKAEPNLDLIVWPETAFIPRIKWHYKYSAGSSSSLLVRELLIFLDDQKIPFLLGNDDAVFNEELYDNVNRESGRLDYNAALLFIPKKNVFPPNPITYRKMHLVPFTEHFPYRKIFPSVYRFLIENDTHFWDKGTDRVVFKLGNLKFGSPICFEDCFGYISRAFYNNGANLIVNITNDAWAKSLVSQYQHFSMAVFRAVENRVPVLRAAISGQTAYIDQNGVVVSMLEPFTSDYLVAEISVPKTIKQKKEQQTIYSLIGDSFAVLCLIITIFAVIIGIFIGFKNKGYEKR